MNYSPFECYGKLALAVALGLAAGKGLADRYIPNSPVITREADQEWESYINSVIHAAPQRMRKGETQQ